MPLRGCSHCGKITSKPKFCTRECYHLSQRKGRMAYCYGCKKEFYLKPHQVNNQWYYCSRECKKENPPTQSRLQCQTCKEYFFVPRALAKKRKFCTKKCAGLSFKRSEKATCSICNTEFEQPRGRPKKYCGQKCAGIAKRKLKTCIICEKDFWVEKGSLKYCSPRCKEQGRRGEKRECQWCGEKFYPKNSNTKFCTITCGKMNDYYGGADLRNVMQSPFEVFIEKGEKTVWLPLSASEIEITTYLRVYKNVSLSETRRAIKRWREARKNDNPIHKMARRQT